MFRHSISRLLVSVQLVMLGVLLVATLLLVYPSFVSWRAAASIEASAVTSRALFDAMVTYRTPIAAIQTALLAEDDPRAVMRETLDAGDASMRAALDSLAESGHPESAQMVSAIEQHVAEADGLRRLVEAEAAKPRAERSTANITDWSDAVIAAVREVFASGTRIADAVRLTKPEVAELLNLRDAAWLVRDNYGRQCGMLRAFVPAGKPMTDDARVQKAGHVGRYTPFLENAEAIGRRGVVSAPVQQAIATMVSSVRKSQEGVDAAIARLDATGAAPMDSAAFTALCNGPYQDIFAAAEIALNDAVAVSRREQQEGLAKFGASAVGLLAVLALSAFGLSSIRRRVTRPMGEVISSIDRLRARDYDTPVPPARYPDEVGRVAEALESLRESAREAARLDAAAVARAAEEAVRADHIRALCAEFDQVMGDSLRAIGRASGLLSDTSQTMDRLAEGASEQAATVSGAADETAANVQTVAAATEQLSASITEISRQLSSSAELARGAVVHARSTDATVEELTEAAQKIGDVTGLISNIASQTNLLALNATIEAARAGEAGKGFAVVASEVKHLADQTSSATGEVSAQVIRIQETTHKTVAAIRTITESIERISAVASTIAAAVEQQGAATADISTSVQRVARGTADTTAAIAHLADSNRRTGEAARKVSGAVDELGTEERGLRRSVERFLVGVQAA